MSAYVCLYASCVCVYMGLVHQRLFYRPVPSRTFLFSISIYGIDDRRFERWESPMDGTSLELLNNQIGGTRNRQEREREKWNEWWLVGEEKKEVEGV